MGWIFSGTKTKRGTRLTQKPMHLNSPLEL